MNCPKCKVAYNRGYRRGLKKGWKKATLNGMLPMGILPFIGAGLSKNKKFRTRLRL